MPLPIISIERRKKIKEEAEAKKKVDEETKEAPKTEKKQSKKSLDKEINQLENLIEQTKQHDLTADNNKRLKKIEDALTRAKESRKDMDKKDA